MTIKSCVSNQPCKKKELPFPKLMKNQNSNLIVFFSEDRKGIAVCEGRCNSIGCQRTDWSMTAFRDFKGSVCLENSDKD